MIAPPQSDQKALAFRLQPLLLLLFGKTQVWNGMLIVGGSHLVHWCDRVGTGCTEIKGVYLVFFVMPKTNRNTRAIQDL